MMPSRPATPSILRDPRLAMTVGTAALALLLWLPVGGGGQASMTAPAAIEPVAETASPERLSQTIAARPLFDVSRRPPQVAAAPAPAPVTIRLVGIIDDAEQQMALLRLSNTTSVRRLMVGDRLDRWTVTGISSSAVEVVDDEGKSSRMVLNSL